MFDTEKRKSGCEFSDSVVEYIYGELTREDNGAFRSHIESCPECSREITSLASVSGAIGEWKSHEFDTLADPGIVPAYKGNSRQEVGANEGVFSLGRLRRLFALYPLVFQTAAATLVIAFAVGIAFIYFAGGSNDEGMAGSQPKEKSRPTEKTSEKNGPAVLQPELAAGVGDIQKTEEEAAQEKATPPRPIRASAPAVTKARPPSKTGKPKKRENRRKSPVEDTTPVPNISPVERLTILASSDETEDEGLRLIELFEETGSDKR